jgi:hypothetical protein
MFVVVREFGSKRILNNIIPYEWKILCGLPRKIFHCIYGETPIPKANNLKVTIGVAELVS